MIDVTFVQPDGRAETHSGQLGDTLMDVALDNGVAGIEAQCGGGCTCCTCHCWIDAAWFERLAPPRQGELELLEYAWGRAAYSRLTCQVDLDTALDGIRVEVPEQQS